MKTRMTVLAPYALAFACLFVFGLTTLAMAGAGSGSTGPGGGCPVATSTSPGCVTLGAFSSSTYTASGVAPQWITTDTGTDTSQSGISAASASSTVAAFTFTPANVLDANDLLLDLKDTVGGTTVFKVDKEGDVTSASSIVATGTIGVTAGVGSVGLYVPGSTYIALGGNNTSQGFIFGVSAGDVSIGTQGSSEFSIGLSSVYPVNGPNDLGKTGNVWQNIYGGTNMRTTCTLNGASPSTCTATVTASAFCTCSPVGSTAAIAAGGCAPNLSGTTLTITGPNAGNWVVNIHCIM